MAHVRLRKFNTRTVHEGGRIAADTADRADREPVCNVVGRHLKGVFPRGTSLIVSGLALPEMLVEIDIEAVIPDSAAA